MMRFKWVPTSFALIALAASVGALISAAKAAEAQGTSFLFKLKGDRVSLQATQRFDSRRTLDEVREVFSDHQLLIEISNLVTRVEVKNLGNSSYILRTTATKKVDVGVKFEKSATTVNRCTETSGKRFWERSCSIVLDQGDTAKFLREGTTSIRCTEAATRDRTVTCVSKTEARPKPIRYWPVYVRSPQQLATAAAREALHDTGIFFLIANTKLSPQAAKVEFNGSRLDQLSARLLEEVRAIVDQDALGDRTVQVEGSDLTNAYSLKVR
ncbi:MAG: hypothetical protein A2X94_05220 [Bdellovibrionales bacterium GWB1_55_8]|nr:MAG: hypothetical protein A2X94_05220 [Bdellovibrionales bacterium GWB1_55_8]